VSGLRLPLSIRTKLTLWYSGLLLAILVLGLASSLACLLPALRATRINPITALRE